MKAFFYVIEKKSGIVRTAQDTIDGAVPYFLTLGPERFIIGPVTAGELAGLLAKGRTPGQTLADQI